MNESLKCSMTHFYVLWLREGRTMTYRADFRKFLKNILQSLYGNLTSTQQGADFKRIFGGNLGLFRGNIGLFRGNVGLFSGSIKLFSGNTGLFGGNIGLFSRNTGLFGGNLGLFCREYRALSRECGALWSTHIGLSEKYFADLSSLSEDKSEDKKLCQRTKLGTMPRERQASTRVEREQSQTCPFPTPMSQRQSDAEIQVQYSIFCLSAEYRSLL